VRRSGYFSSALGRFVKWTAPDNITGNTKDGNTKGQVNGQNAPGLPTRAIEVEVGGVMRGSRMYSFMVPSSGLPPEPFLNPSWPLTRPTRHVAAVAELGSLTGR
jgi:hypothetical protein